MATYDMTDDEMRTELETFSEYDLAQHLKENNPHLITQEQFELVESILEHTMELADGKEDH